MRAAMLVGCVGRRGAVAVRRAVVNSVQQATAAHVTPGMRAAMSDAGQANCAMIGGSPLSVARQLDGSASAAVRAAAERQTLQRWRA